MKKTLFIFVFWVLSLTWNSILTIIGFFATIIALLCKGRIHRNGCSIIIEIGGEWGGINLGAFSLSGTYSLNKPETFIHNRCHEFGHAVQGLIFGPLQIFIVAIPSAIRYWKFVINDKKGIKNEQYDDIWFEYTASKWGHKWINFLEDKAYPYNFVLTKKKN